MDTVAGVTLLEADLLERGYLVSAPLRQALTALTPSALAEAGRDLLADIDRVLGADRDHVPLFRGFPDSTVTDTVAFYADRVAALLSQSPRQPCALCGTEGTVHPVSPCAHPVCRACFDGADFSACPICHRRIDAGDPFLRQPRHRRPAGPARRALPDRPRVLAHGGHLADRAADADNELDALLARGAALGPEDSEHLRVLLATRDPTDVSWLPAAVPGRETKALLLAWLLREPAAHPVTLPVAKALVNTATDVLRLLAAHRGGDAGLVTVPRVTGVSRPQRRALLGILDGLDPTLWPRTCVATPRPGSAPRSACTRSSTPTATRGRRSPSRHCGSSASPTTPRQPGRTGTGDGGPVHLRRPGQHR